MRNWWRIFQNKTVLMLLYFGVMPSLLGSALATYCLYQTQEVRNFSVMLLLLLQLPASIVLAGGFMPTTFYSLLGGYMLGWSCVPYLFFSYLMASILGYGIGMKVDHERLLNLLEAKYPVRNILHKLRTSGLGLAIFCRLSPTLPFAILNTLFAIARYPLQPYLIGSVIGMIPRTLFAVFVGSSFYHVTNIDELKSDSSLWVAVGLAIISFVGIGWVVKKKFF